MVEVNWSMGTSIDMQELHAINELQCQTAVHEMAEDQCMYCPDGLGHERLVSHCALLCWHDSTLAHEVSSQTNHPAMSLPSSPLPLYRVTTAACAVMLPSRQACL